MNSAKHIMVKEFTEYLIQNYFKLNYELSKLSPTQQTLVFVLIIILIMILCGFIVAMIVGLLGGHNRVPDEERRRDYDAHLKLKIKRRNQRLAADKRYLKHRPFKLKFVEFFYQLFR